MGFFAKRMKRDKLFMIFLGISIVTIGALGVTMFWANNDVTNDQYSIEDIEQNPAVLSDSYQPIRPDIYYPTWLERTPATDKGEGNYADISRLPGDKIGSYIIAFATPTASGRLQMPPLDPVIRAPLDEHKARGGTLSLAVGGYGVDEAENKRLATYWARVLENPRPMTDDLMKAVSDHGLSQIDIDMEYPAPNQKDAFTQFIAYLHGRLPSGVSLTMAVPAQDLESYGYDLSENGLPKYVSRFNIMTYDNSGRWSTRAGDVAPSSWVQQRIDEWVNVIGDEAKISVGYPAYCYEFVGAAARGDRFASTKSLAYASLLKRGVNVRDDIRRGVSYVNGDNWISCQSPMITSKIQAKIKQRHPKIGGAFYWHAGGVVDEHIDAVR